MAVIFHEKILVSDDILLWSLVYRMNNLYEENEKAPRPLQMIHVLSGGESERQEKGFASSFRLHECSVGLQPGQVRQGVSRTAAYEAIGIETHSEERADFGCR